MDAFRNAVMVKYVEIAAAQKKSTWPVIVDAIMDTLVMLAAGPLGQAAATAAADSGRTISTMVTGVMKWAKGMAKSASASIPTGEKGKLVFLQVLSASTGPIGEYFASTLPANLDDAGLTILNTYWREKALDRTVYVTMIESTLSRFDKQVGDIGEPLRDENPFASKRFAAAHMFHAGKDRVAIVKSSAMGSGPASPWRFEQWADRDMAPLAVQATIDRFDGSVGPFYVDAGDTADFERTEKLDRALADWDNARP